MEDRRGKRRKEKQKGEGGREGERKGEEEGREWGMKEEGADSMGAGYYSVELTLSK